MSEISLLIFSFCLQAAIGIMWFMALGHQLYKGKVFKVAGVTTAILSIIGVLASLIHLGRPFSALNTLSHLGSSWLSNEVLSVGFFMAIAVIYAIVQYIKPGKQGLSMLLAGAASIIGAFSIFAMAKVYTTTVVPVWHGINTFVDFYTTALAVGALLFVALSLKVLGNSDKRIYGFIVLATVIIQAAVAVPHAITLSVSGQAAQASAEILNGMGVVIGLKWLLSLGGAGILIWPLTQKADTTKPLTHIIYVAGAALIIGEFIGRYVFYVSLIASRIGLT